MEYERIHKIQTGMISPSKLRMKLIGSSHHKKKDGSNNNSSRTSPSRIEDSEFVNNSLLAAQNGDFEEEASSLEVPPIKSGNSVSNASQGDGNSLQSKELMLKENDGAGRFRMQLVSKADGSNSSSVHPVGTYEDETIDYDSTSSFEFHKGERSLQHSLSRSLSRPLSSKWNDAEKWIMNRQNIQSGVSKKINVHNEVNRPQAMNMVRVAPESTSSENKPSVKRVDFCQPASQTGSAKFAFTSHGAAPSGQGNGGNMMVNSFPEIKDLTEADEMGLPCTKNVTEETTGGLLPSGTAAIRSVSMRDMGTEMTPIPSQEPSRSTTPIGATTPLRSPNSSIPSTPRREEPTPPTKNSITSATQNLAENRKLELSGQEQKLKTRREIVALGVQLGKMNIAAWASKDEKERSISGNETTDADQLERIAYAEQATAWEEAEKSKHAARLNREEIRIQAWESQQKAKLEAKMKKIEAQIEQMRAQAQAKMVKKITLARQKSEEKRAAAEARKNRQAVKIAAQAEYVRRTGQIPSSPFICCGWS